MAINSYDLGGGSTVGVYRPYQRQAKDKNEEEETVDTTPENDPTSSTIGTIAGVADTVNNGAKLYEKYNGANINTSGVGDTSSEGNTDSVSSGQNVGKVETPELDYRYSITQETPTPSVDDSDFLNYVNEHYDNVRLQNLQNDFTEENPNAVTLNGVIQGKESPYRYTINNTGDKANIQLNGFRTDDGVVGARDLGDVGLDWWTARNVALPVLQYAAQYKSLDTKGRWIQSGKTLQKVMQGFAGKYEGTNIPAKTLLDEYYISNFVDIADMTTNWSNRSDFNNAMAAANSAMNMIKNFGWEEYIGGKEGFSNAYDGLALLNFGNSLYQLTNNWDKMNDGEKTAATVQTMLTGMQAYDGGTSLIKAFAPAAEAATPAANAAGAASGAASAAPVTSSFVKSAASGGVGTTGGAASGTASGQLMTPATGVGEYTSATTGEAVTEGGMAEATLAESGQGGITSSAGNTAMNEGVVNAGTNTGANAGSSVASTVGGSLMAVLGAYSMYKGIEGMSQSFGYGTADSRKSSAIAGAGAGAGAAAVGIGSAIAMGASIGSSVPVIGTIIGAVVGAVVGVCTGSAKTGKSHEQRARDNWRQAYADAGVFSRSLKADNSGHSMAMQLADGSWYDVGIDGSGSRARMMDGTVKSFANPDLLTPADRHRIVNEKTGEARTLLPYNVDYTNALDFVGSLMMGGMIIPIGGSYQKNRTAEVPQMLGYMTNGITSNCGREFTLNNYQIMTANAKTMYAKIGITNKYQMINCASDAYFQGKLSKADYYNMLLSSNLIYDENGFQQAQGLMANSGKAGMGTSDAATGNATAPENTGE